MKIRRFPLPMFMVLAVLGMVCLDWSSAVHAQDQPDDSDLRGRLKRVEKDLREVRSIVLQARATGHPVEIKDAGPDPQVTDLETKVDDIGQTLRGLTGQIETLTHDLDMARKDAAQAQAQSAAAADRLDRLEKQVAALSAPPPGPAASTGPPTRPATDAEPPPSGDDPKTAYAQARKLLLDGDYPAASTAFQDYIDRYGDTTNAPAARYWLGETKYIQSDYAGAATALISAIHGWPQTSWAPDAVVKLSLALVQLNKSPDACQALAEFSRHYARTAPPATKARAKAARLKADCGA
jgi:tol-pal system protein YbgF